MVCTPPVHQITSSEVNQIENQWVDQLPRHFWADLVCTLRGLGLQPTHQISTSWYHPPLNSPNMNFIWAANQKFQHVSVRPDVYSNGQVYTRPPVSQVWTSYQFHSKGFNHEPTSCITTPSYYCFTHAYSRSTVQFQMANFMGPAVPYPLMRHSPYVVDAALQ